MVSPFPTIDATCGEFSMLCSSFFQMDLCGSIGATYSEVVEGAEGVGLLGQVLILSHLIMEAFEN